MKTVLKYILLLMICNGCKAQNNIKNTTKMKTFDIATFEKNKIGNEYFFITKDSTVVKQSDDDYEYYETVKSKESFFQIINRYYKSGKIKLEGQIFQNFFQKGVWKEYDEEGKLLKETDYDKPYKFTWEDILKYIKKRKLDMNAYGFEVTRSFGFDTENIGKETEKPFWAITYNKSEENMLLGVVIMDGITGEIIKEYTEPYPSEE
jgi:hypothetical protein